MTDVAVVSTAGFNLFSISKMTKNGWILNGDADVYVLTKGNQEIKVDIKVNTPKGMVYCLYIKQEGEMATAATDQGATMTLNAAHAKCNATSGKITQLDHFKRAMEALQRMC